MTTGSEECVTLTISPRSASDGAVRYALRISTISSLTYLSLKMRRIPGKNKKKKHSFSIVENYKPKFIKKNNLDICMLQVYN